MLDLRSSLAGIVCLLAASAHSAFCDSTWNPDPSLGNVSAHKRLYELARDYCDAHFDPAANLVNSKMPVPNPHDHLVRESAYYAYALLLTGDPSDRAKAQDIIKAVLATQDTHENSAWRGAFLWRKEDDWPSTKNPDLNSAAFVGTALAEIALLDRDKPCLDPDVRSALDAAGKLAVEELFRRDVDAGYTNIALLSTALSTAGAKLWSVPGAADWADHKLSLILKLADDGAVYEYSSPTYSAVDINAAYMIRQFAFSDAFAAKADAIIDHLWKEVSLAYHAPSCQLGGPYCRAYGNDMLTYAAGLKYDLFLALDGKYPLPEKPELGHGWDQGGQVITAGLPIKPRPEFDQPAPAERAWDAAGNGPSPVRHLFQYRNGNFILGTVANQDEWKQKRNLVADWRTDDSSAPLGFRVGFCIDESNETLPGGFPYATILFHSQQKKDAALIAQVAMRGLPPSGACSLCFSTNAHVVDPKTVPVVVQDGAYTTYLYPVTNSPVEFQTVTVTKTDQPTLQVNRPWSSADTFDKCHVIAYVAVFRPADQPAPKATNLTLGSANGHISATANVDGQDLAIDAPAQ